jgi:SAM-dependent methyltransferase
MPSGPRPPAALRSPAASVVPAHRGSAAVRRPAPPRAADSPPLAPGAAGGSGRVLREVLSPGERAKLNRADDRLWYDQPRFVNHSDDDFRQQVTQTYRALVPPGGAVLDLASSWVSHLPPEVQYARVVGHGLNAAELARNPRLDASFVRNLNEAPLEPFALAAGSVDAALCCCSVQYFQQAEAVFAEVHRVLKPGGIFITTFTNRLFYEKAVAAWRDASMYGRAQLVAQYFGAVEGYGPATVLKAAPGEAPPRAPLEAAAAAARRLFGGGGGGDPFYAVYAYKE